MNSAEKRDSSPPEWCARPGSLCHLRSFFLLHVPKSPKQHRFGCKQLMLKVNKLRLAVASNLLPKLKNGFKEVQLNPPGVLQSLRVIGIR